MSPSDIVLQALIASGVFMALCALGYSLVRWAKHGGKSRQAMGAMLVLFSWGHMRDPRNDTVAEAQDGRVRKGETSGDPLERDGR